MFGIGFWELMLVFIIVLLLFGGRRLPEVATGLGAAIKNFKTALKDNEADEQKKEKPPDLLNSK